MKKLFDKIWVTCDTLRNYATVCAGDVGKVEFTESDYKNDNIPPKEGWNDFSKGTRVSGKDKHFWFRINFKTPTVTQYQHIVLTTSTGYEGERDTINPQSMVFINGKLVQALDTNHTEVRLEADADYEVYIYFYMGSVDESCEFKIGLSYIDEPTLQLYYDLFVPLEACRDVYVKNSYEYTSTVKILEQACNLLDLNYPYTNEYYERIDAARKLLKTDYYEKLCGNNPVTVNCIGHTHIDVAWLWTLAQTKEKIQRSFATVIELMKYYPEYRFMMSQPQLFKYLSQIDPLMYAQVKELVKSGRWELEGAMWLEADCNLISGESMVRQILHGKRFLKEEFDIDSKVLWLPDVFGYSAAMPQILKKSGITHFVTSKISWNDTNIMPCDTFIWQGIDGSEIITDFITTQNYRHGGNFQNETTYVGLINPTMVAGAWNRYQQKEYNDSVMLVYGWGDGGGGPTADMLEQQRRLAYGLPGLPKTKMTSLGEHLSIVEKNFSTACKQLGRVPKWVGELYLEFHRGTYTSMAKNKRYNRKSEFMLQKLESIASINSALLGSKYPQKDIYSLWDIVLLNQFHDIIPGSSIREVYNESWQQYEELLAKSNEMFAKYIASIAENVDADGGLLVYNSLGVERSDIIRINGRCYETDMVPAYGWKVIEPQEKQSRVRIANGSIENDMYILTIDAAGRITRLYDKRFEREVIAENAFANEFRIYEDMPKEYENWELAEYYSGKCRVLDAPARISVMDDGCRRGFKIEHKYHNSVIIQYIYLYDTIERIDVRNEIEWAERKQLVKIAFPFNIHTTKANYDIQFGNVERNTHANTSWDAAKFEVCGHKWVDFSEYNYGVSLLNDCKYGFSAQENILMITALKCGTYPNKEADQGHHEFSYSIYPHGGDYRIGNTVRAAYSFNQPLEYTTVISNKKHTLPTEFSFVNTVSENVVIDTVKKCEDSDDIIIRIYDAYNCVSSTVIKLGVPICKAELCDLMEQPLEELPIENNSVKVKLKNFEIATIKIKVDSTKEHKTV